MGFTKNQETALNVKDRTLLVSAGAGSGKTFTLIERIIRMLTDSERPADITELLIVTFTNAAVAEIKTRVEKALLDAMKKDPKNHQIERQLALLPAANIMTVDSLCQEFLKKNAESLGLLPNYRIADTAEISLLASDVMDAVLTDFYEGAYADVATVGDFLELTDTLVGVKESETGIADILLRLYAKTQNRENGVFGQAEIERYFPDAEQPTDTPFGRYLLEKTKASAEHFSAQYQNLLKELDPYEKNECKWQAVLGEDADFLSRFLSLSDYEALRDAYRGFVFAKAPSVSSKTGTDKEYRAKELRAAFKKSFFHDRQRAVFACTADEFMDCYERTKKAAKTICAVLLTFHQTFREEKRRLGVCEYADLERYYYESLWKDGKITPLAEMQREQYRMIFVDEYQDISPIQHKIFEALAKDDNRFMVGDIKQSIYGFRAADPTIFAGMKTASPICDSTKADKASTVYMSENFRCDEGIVNTVNEIFGVLFHAIADTIGYVDDEAMIYKKENDAPLRKTKVLLVQRSDGEPEEDQIENVLSQNKGGVAREAVVMAKEILALTEENKDDGKPISFGDIVILMRSTTNMPTIIDILTRFGIPCRGPAEKEFFKNPSVLLALSLLNTIDNPYRDIYLCGVLLSPLFGFTPDDLESIRQEKRDAPLYVSLCAYCEKHENFEKGRAFLRQLETYRSLSSGTKPDALLFRLYHETGLLTLAVQNHGDDNLWLLYENARKFQNSSYEGLGAFIRYVNRILDSDGKFDSPDMTAPSENAVRLMTVHASKGLEFPVVFVPECERILVDRDASLPLLFSEELGIAPILYDKTGTVKMETPMRLAIKSLSARNMLDEEMRIFYVALTRAAERLYLVANTADTYEKWQEKRDAAREQEDKDFAVKEANSYLAFTMLGAKESVEYIFTENAEFESDPFLSQADTDGIVSAEERPADVSVSDSTVKEDLAEILKGRFAFSYPDKATIGVPEKLSVSKLYPTVLDGNEDFDTASFVTVFEEPKHQVPRFLSGEVEDLAAKRGIATHAFLQFCDFENLQKAGAEAELKRLTDNRFLSKEDAELVRLDEIEKFRRSDLEKAMREAKTLYREFRFHVQLPAEDFTSDPEKKRALSGKNILVQGVMDCVMENPDGALTLVDYKTDRLPPFAVENHKAAATILKEKHEKQLSYYKEAVRQIFGKYPEKTQIYAMMLGIMVDL